MSNNKNNEKSAEELRKEGNSYFQQKCWKKAIESYTDAIHKLQESLQNSNSKNDNNNNDLIIKKATLLSNRSLCCFQLFDSDQKKQDDPKSEQRQFQLLKDVIQDTSLSLDLLLNGIPSTTSTSSNSNNIRPLRAKLLYRRAKANNAMSIATASATASASASSSASNQNTTQQSQISAVKDLHDLLSFDPKNKLAQTLLMSIKQRNNNGSSTSSSSSPIQRALSIICQYYVNHNVLTDGKINIDGTKKDHNNHNENDDETKNIIQALQFICASLVDDFISTSEEILSFQSKSKSSSSTSTPSSTTTKSTPTTIFGLQVLYNLAFHNTTLHSKSNNEFVYKCQSLTMQILNEACMYVPIMTQLHHYHSKQLQMQNKQEFILNTIVNDMNNKTNKDGCSNDNDNNDDESQSQSENNISEISKSIETYIQLSMTFYIRYILYMYSKEDNTIYEAIRLNDHTVGGEKESTSSAKVETGAEVEITMSKDSLLIVEYLIPILLQMFPSSSEAVTSSMSLSSSYTDACQTTTHSLLHAIIETNPQIILDQIQQNTNHSSTKTNTNTKLLHNYPNLKNKSISIQQIQGLNPRELALYRKKEYKVKQYQKKRCRDIVIRLCSCGGLDVLLGYGIALQSTSSGGDNSGKRRSVDSAYWRKEIMITISKIIQCFLGVSHHDNHQNQDSKKKDNNDKEEGEEKGFRLNDEELKRLVVEQYYGPGSQSLASTTPHKLTIEIIDEEDESKNSQEEEIGREKNNENKTHEDILIKCLLSTSMLLADGALGSWVLRKAWTNSQNEWRSLVIPSSNHNNNNIEGNEENIDHRSMSIASELASAAAGTESARSWIISCTGGNDNDMIWKHLLSSEDQDVRSGAASAMAKLGLADKAISSDEGELFALLEVAGGLIVGDGNTISTASTSTLSRNSNSLTQLERGVELLSYLSSKTMIKDEIADGFTIKTSFKSQNSSSPEKSILENLVDLAAIDGSTSEGQAISSTVSYALSIVFSSLAVSLETLRKEAFAGKEITAEQYDQLQAMGKTDEEKGRENSKVDDDDPKSVCSRIQMMAEKGVCRALVNLNKKGATEATREQIVICMMRMSTEQSVRGKMIQTGCLSECIQISKVNKHNGSLSEMEQKIIRYAQHSIGKILVTTNPILLTTSQRMGCVQPLIQLVRDNDATDLQRFESLLALTNLAGYDDETKQRIISERGISVLSYAMFSDHEMVRRAATEAMSNLVPHPDLIEHMQQPEKLKVWIAFASDFDQNYDCARAALGCLAMLTMYPTITSELCKLSNTKKMVESVLSSGKLELMHRVLVAVLNIMEYKSEWILSSGTLAFCEAYIIRFHDGKESSKLQFSASDKQLLKVTLDIAKEIVQACPKKRS